MSEKVRAFNLTASGNALTSPAAAAVAATTPSTSASGVSGGCALIGAPTLISSTFSGSSTQALTPTASSLVVASAAGGGGGDVSSSVHHTLGHTGGSGILVVGGGGGGGGSDTESQSEYAAGALTTQLNFHLLPNDGGAGALTSVLLVGDGNSIMNSSQISTTSNDSMQLSSNTTTASSSAATNVKSSGNGKHLAAQSVAGKSCRFPKLEECAHFHYERVQLGPLSVRLVDDKSELLSSSIASQSIGGDIDSSQLATVGGLLATSSTGPASFRSFSPSNCWFIIKVFPHRCDPFLIKRSFDNMEMLDEMLHRCVYDRKISGLKQLHELEFKSEEDVEYAVAKYLERFSKIASDSLTCGTILTWLQLDNKGRRLPLADSDTMRSINTPAVGAAYGVRRYQAQASDEISIEVGDMISVIDMPSPAESIWWRGKKSHMQKSHYEVGFFPQSCVATIGDKVPRNCRMPPPLVGQLDVSPTKPVLRKHGKLIAFFRSFILSRPSRRRLKQSGIYRERVFSCDLSEHLLNSGQEIPMVLKCCAEFIEEYGIIDGIYRLSGITSNIQKLRRAFDEERIPDLGNPEMKQDIHAVSSLLKMYFRELPNPLCTYQLYDNFVEAIQEKSESNERLRLMKETVLKLPPPHYRTLKYLSEHLNKISQHSARTGMTDKNLAIVWAPNLLRSPALESGGVAALRGVGVQAVVTEYLIRNCHHIFDALEDANARLSYIATAGAAQAPAVELRLDSLTDCESLLVEQREHDQSLTFNERPKSLGAGGPKLISLEEAQERHSRLDNFDIKQSMPISVVASTAVNIGSYIEVGGGPSSLPDKYHTVLSVPRNWQKRKTHSWKSLFTRNQRTVGSGGAHDLKTGHNARLADADSLPPHHKEATQVTFAASDAIIGGASSKGGLGKSMLKQEKTKSIELFETTRASDAGKPMEVCVRSNSIDSLRTAGHSRSVSHDSYFDLLQSPQRGHMTTCPSRELSELGLNFDREEPEMRIFSESESLVSSPRVGKENIPPSSGATSRRILRARPEEFSSQTNSVNPSPKKQPRLNLLLSPSAAAGAVAASSSHAWPSQQHQPQHQSASAADQCNDNSCHEHNHLSSDESCCKRYKLEDQLSDIQFIDCSTPEHQIANAQTLYTSVQVHAPPKSALSQSSLYSSTESASKLQDAAIAAAAAAKTATERKFAQAAKMSDASSATAASAAANARYSYPTVQLGAKRKDQECAAAAGIFKERFSYPGSSGATGGNERRYSAKEHNKMQVEEQQHAGYSKRDIEAAHLAAHARAVSFHAAQGHAVGKLPASQQQLPPKGLPDLLRPKNRSSYCGNSEQLHNLLLLRSSSSELCKDPVKVGEHERAKLSVTPSSPVQSPRYSLLLGETSSENSSAVNTPQYDLDPLMVASAMSGLSCLSGTSSNQQQQLLLNVDAASSYLGNSRESLGSNHTSHAHINAEKRDMHALKRELSLDLQTHTGGSTKMAIDQLDGYGNTLPAKLQLQQQHGSMLPSPNNSNFTDNTSQSVTPSEFGYQHLQRQSSMHSLIETAENSPAYEEYENTPSNLMSPLLGGGSTPKLPSPIKSTISITYNLKSPKEEEAVAANGRPLPPLREKTKAKTLLETSFDEHTVYEQVKFFRNSVTEVNQMLHEERKSTLAGLEQLSALEEQLEQEQEMSQRATLVLGAAKVANKPQPLVLDDIQMCVEPPAEGLNSLTHEQTLLYENVELRKPHSVYENVLGEQMKQAPATALNSNEVAAANLNRVGNLTALETEPEPELEPQVLESAARKSPSNFSVKELATKFESSPVEQLSPFDFSLRSSMRKQPQQASNSTSTDMKATQSSLITETSQLALEATTKVAPPPASKLKQQLNKSQQITRSLDENAFVREFGAKHLHDLAARSIQQLPELTEVCQRRKSFDFTRPKTLNPPKRLPGMPITEEYCGRSELLPTHKFDLHKERHFNHTHHTQSSDNNSHTPSHSSIEHDYESAELKITPTTENRISLIQHNVAVPAASVTSSADLSNSNLHVSSNSSSLKVLSGVKLDRERIDKIKEERRQQLTQKYRGDTNFKSKSKTDLHSTGKEEDKFSNAETLRVKSKSRGDMRTLQKDMDNHKQFTRASSTVGSLHAASESTLHTSGQRVRSISDEQNQNCETNNHMSATSNGSGGHNTATATAAKQQNNHNSYVAPVGNVKSSSPQCEQEEYSARATVQKFERKCLDYANGTTGNSTTLAAVAGSGNAAVVGGSMRERRSEAAAASMGNTSSLLSASRSSLTSTREKISPQFSIRDVTAMFESRSQNQQ